ncbi:hypothetical protein HanIR_Chr09g0440571 [Helianthus annuus]|nr:hypothetical protein HanIR_Chr09g0440571 [Helianthus annuus]
MKHSPLNRNSSDQHKLFGSWRPDLDSTPNCQRYMHLHYILYYSSLFKLNDQI